MTGPAGAPPPPSSTKAGLRAWARTARDRVSEVERAAAAARIAALVDEQVLAGLPAGAIVALYAAMGSELSTTEIDRRARTRGLEVAYPRVVRGEKPLRFHLARRDELIVATFGVPEPAATAPTVAPAAIAAAIVPGLAFTVAGDRLGWGAGHYDATLPALGGPAIGVALACQLVEELPHTEHDHRVAMVVTEAGVVRCGGAS